MWRRGNMKHTNDKMIEFAKFCIDNGYGTSSHVTPYTLDLFEKSIDPYRELKEAQERGEEIEMLDNDGIWVTGDTFNWSFNNPPERYRIKPKTKKIYLWALEDSNGWFISQAYMQTEEELRKYYAHKGDCPVRRLDNTMIEVEDV
jgi:hypothetical protein